MRDAPFPSRPNRRATLLACACLFTLSACASGSQSIHPTAVLVDTTALSAGKDIARAITQPGAPASTSWWTAWGDPQLDRLIASGTVTAPSIAEAAARMRSAAAGVDAATADRLPTVDGEMAARRHQIAALLGRDPAFADGLAPPSLKAIGDPAPLSAIPASLLGARPDVAAARATVEAAAREIGVVRAAFYPDVNLIAFTGVQSIGLGSLLRAGSIATGAGPAVSLPIFDGGRLRANLRGKTAEYDAALAAYNGTLTEALNQVADGVTGLTSERARQSEAWAAVAHWSRILDLQKLRERQGLSGTVDRLSTETALLLAQRRVAEADARVAIAQVALIRALGGAWAPTPSLSGQAQ